MMEVLPFDSGMQGVARGCPKVPTVKVTEGARGADERRSE